MTKIFLVLLLSIQCALANDKNIPITKEKQTYYLKALIDEHEFNMLVDTGSSFVVLTKNPGLKPTRKIVAILADGRKSRTDVYKIPEIKISGCVIRNVDAIVMPNGINILGMTALHKMSPVTLNMKTGSLIFECGNYPYNPLILQCRGCYSRSYRKI